MAIFSNWFFFIDSLTNPYACYVCLFSGRSEQIRLDVKTDHIRESEIEKGQMRGPGKIFGSKIVCV